MIRFTNSVDIARPPAEVFAYLADLEHTPHWNWAISSTRRVTPGPVSVGTRFRQTRTVPRPAVEELEVITLDPPRRLEVIGDLASFRAHLAYDLSPIGIGTRLTNSVELDSPGPMGLLGGLFTSRIQPSVAKNLGALRGVLEGSRRQQRDHSPFAR